MSRRTLHAAAALLLGVLALARPLVAQSPEVPNMQPPNRTFLFFEVLEFAPAGVESPVRYDFSGWHGGDVNRVWFKADGEQGTTAEGGGEAELQLAYGRLIHPFWDAQLGVRVDAHYGEGETNTRVALAVGLQGLAPYWFELEPTLYLDQGGIVSAGLTAAYELLLTQRLVVEPRLESFASLKAVPEFGIGRGLNDVELGLRARYEFRREFAPYVGVVWARRVGGTADLAHAAGEPVRELSFVAGVRLWR